MDNVFPIGLPWPTAFYTTLYVLTFALHQALMHYVLAGCAYVAWTTLFRGSGEVPRSRQPLAAALRDWMPFAMSAAITAGVAPLLFIQILYPEQFYTANLLLAWRWMALIPVLIVAFYLLYVMKSKAIADWPLVLRAGVSVVAAVCFVFVGFCWTSNYMLSTSAARWAEIYASGQFPLPLDQLVPRMMVWFGGAFATLAVLASWQLGTWKDENSAGSQAGTISFLALCGLDVALASGLHYLWRAEIPVRELLLGRVGLPYLILLIVGLAAQYGAWLPLWWRGRGSRALVVLATIGWLVTLVSTSVLREIIRMNAINVAAIYEQHAEAIQIGGFWVFFALAIVNGGVIAGCIWIVRQSFNRS